MAAAAVDRMCSETRLASHVLLSESGGPTAPFAGKYAVLRVLGQGGMGTVFEARHLRLGHRVAIKVLGSELRDYPELVTRFEREARAASALSSPHAVRVLDIDMTEDGTPFIVMELLAGRDLAHVVETEGAQPIGRAVRWVMQACDAIAEAHRLGIVHRDLKPSNLFLSDRGEVKVLDFGIAKRVAAKEASITQGVAPLGTPQYMSPEQVRCAKDVDARTDIWSLGVTLYELVTGRTPFAHEESTACIASIAADPVPDPRTFKNDIPEELAKIILHALEKNPSDRFPSIDELVRELAPFADHADEGDLPTAMQRPPSFSDEQDTLGEEDLAVIPKGHASIALPLVSRASVPKKARRWRAPLAFGTATVLGLAALVLTPRCATRIDAPATSVVQASPPTIRAAAQAAEPPAAEQVLTNTAAPEADPVVDLDAVVPAPVAAPAPKPIVLKRVAPAPAAKPARTEVVTDSPVHGGLSNPGF